MFPERFIDVAILCDQCETKLKRSPWSPCPYHSMVKGRIVPHFLTARDHIWVEHTLDMITAVVGKSRKDVEAHLNEAQRWGAPWRAWHALCFLLLHLYGFKISACTKPMELRSAVFGTAAKRKDPYDNARVVEQVAQQINFSPKEIEKGLYADLPGERVLNCPQEEVTPQVLMEKYNLALAQSLLWRTEWLSIRLKEHVKTVLRMARLRGLLCLAERDKQHGDTVLRLSGPLSLFHYTTKYGRAMAAWLPILIRTPCWSLNASCILGKQRLSWKASFRDPLGTTHASPRRFDSMVEEKLFRDLKKMKPHWEILREADAVQIGKRIITPDFTLVVPEKKLRIPVEIVGFWTPEYLRDKIETLRQLPMDQGWVLCVDNKIAKGVAERALYQLDIFWFSRKIDAKALIDFLKRTRF